MASSLPHAVCSSQGSPLWLVSTGDPRKARSSPAYQMQAELSLPSSPLAAFALSDAQPKGSLLGLVLCEPAPLSVLTPINEIDRWQMRSIAAAIDSAALGSDSRHGLQIPPHEVWGMVDSMQCLSVRDSYVVAQPRNVRPRFTDGAGHWHTLGLLQEGSGVGPGAPPLLRRPGSAAEGELVTCASVLHAWGIAEPFDGHRCAYMLCLSEFMSFFASRAASSCDSADDRDPPCSASVWTRCIP